MEDVGPFVAHIDDRGDPVRPSVSDHFGCSDVVWQGGDYDVGYGQGLGLAPEILRREDVVNQAPQPDIPTITAYLHEPDREAVRHDQGFTGRANPFPAPFLADVIVSGRPQGNCVAGFH